MKRTTIDVGLTKKYHSNSTQLNYHRYVKRLEESTHSTSVQLSERLLILIAERETTTKVLLIFY